MNPLALLGSGGSIVAVLVLLSGMGGAAALVVHEHDARIVAEVASKQAAAVAQEQRAETDREIADLTTAKNTAIARLTALASLKEQINAAPKTTTCTAAPAVRALLNGLRSRAGSGNAGPAGKAPANSMAVPSAADPSRGWG